MHYNANDVLWSKKLNKIFSGTAGTVAVGTNPVSGWFVDVSRKLSILVFDIVDYGAVADGVQPAVNASLGAPATGTDNSSAIKSAVAAAQLAVSSGVTQGSIDPAVEVLITTSVKGLYRVDGTNLFGWQFPQGSQTANVKMRVDLRGSSILWNVPVGGVFIDNAYALYAPKYCGYSLFLFGFTGQRGVFFRTNNPPLATFNPLQSPVFEGLVVRGGSAANEGRAATLGNHFDAIFDITAGTNLCDRGLIENCTFYQWSTFFRSANKEAVGWSIDDSSTLMSYVDGATLCSWTVPWSGNMRFDNSDIIMKGTNQTLFKATDSTGAIPIMNSGEIAISCRIETNSSGVKLVEATHGAYRFSGANFAAGSVSPGTNTIGDVLGIASVSFDNCVNVPDSVTVSAFVYSNQFPNNIYSVYVAPNCAVYGDALSIDRVLVWGSGSPLEYIAAINSGYYIPNILCDTRLPLVAGRTPTAKMQLIYRELSYGFNTSAGNSVVNAANNSFSTKLPPQMLVDKINVYVTTVAAATADSIGCYIDDVLFNTILVSPSSVTRVSALPLNQVLTNSSEATVNLSFKPLLAGNIVNGETILFKAFVRVRGFIDKNDINSAGNVVLISDRNPTW